MLILHVMSLLFKLRGHLVNFKVGYAAYTCTHGSVPDILCDVFYVLLHFRLVYVYVHVCFVFEIVTQLFHVSSK